MRRKKEKKHEKNSPQYERENSNKVKNELSVKVVDQQHDIKHVKLDGVAPLIADPPPLKLHH